VAGTCGYYRDPARSIACSSTVETRYQKRISGSLMDRIHLTLQVLLELDMRR
jgi:predicted ATPase with chaperone activity